MIQGILILFLYTILSIYPAHAAEPGDLHVIVMFEDDVDPALIKAYGGEIDDRLEGISSLSASVSPEAVAALKRNPAVQAVEIDHKVYAEGQTVGAGLQKIGAVPLLSTGLTGNGVKVAVLDSGIDLDHPDLRIVGGVSVMDYTKSYNDDSKHGHGTHVAGIIAALNNDIGIVGVAPEADLYAVKVLDQEGVGMQSGVIAGIEWAIDHNMDIINLSLSSSPGSLALKKELQKAYGQGILVVGAVGNAEFRTGNDTVEYPARYDTVIAVAAIDEHGEHPNYSAKGPDVELSAPGAEIKSTYNDGKYKVMTGTSMAAPFVTGVIALYEQKNPGVDPGELRKVLRSQAKDLGAKGKDSLFGYGLVQAPTVANVDITKPTIPGNIAVSETDVGEKWLVNLSWEAARDNGKVSKYEVFRNGEKIAAVKDTEFKEIRGRGRFRYKIRAVDQAGNKSGFSAAAEVMHFTDVAQQSWYASYVYALYSRGFVKGYPDGEFRPHNPLTRAEAVTMLGRALRLDGTKRKTAFPDVEADFYASGYIESAYEDEIVEGYPDGAFHPEDSITRGEVAYIISRAYQLKKGSCGNDFSDVNPSAGAYDVIDNLCSAGIAQGYPDGTFRPENKVTRAEFAAFLIRAIGKMD